MRRRILFVGMVNSPHAAKWVRLLADQGWDLHFFPVHPQRPHALMEGVTVHYPWRQIFPRQLLIKRFPGLVQRYRPHWKALSVDNHTQVKALYPIIVVSSMLRGLGVLQRFYERLRGASASHTSWLLGSRALSRLIRLLQPDLIHSMEFQHAGYTVLETKKRMGNQAFPKWLATNWGSDIFYYRQFEDHQRKISELLRSIDYYSCECARDVTIAQEMGLTAPVMPVFPNTGGLDIEALRSLRHGVFPSQRKVIMVKGYQHFAGRALTALAAIEAAKEALAGYEILVFSVCKNSGVSAEVARLREECGLTIAVLEHTNHAAMMGLFAQSRLYLGVSISDGISTSMLEAMAMGTFPIQTNTACCDEWLIDGKSGFIIPPDDVALIADRIRMALTDDALINQAAELNWKTVCERADQRLLQQQEIALYDRIFADIRR